MPVIDGLPVPVLTRQVRRGQPTRVRKKIPSITIR